MKPNQLHFICREGKTWPKAGEK